MKGGAGVSSYTLPAKRRWRSLAIGVVGLVVLSMLVPLLFLLGLHNRFYFSGYVTEQSTAASGAIKVYDQPNGDVAGNLPQDGRNSEKEVDDIIVGFPVPIKMPNSLPKHNNTIVNNLGEVISSMEGIDNGERLCQLKYGSYCLWWQEHKEIMEDFMVKKMKDQLFVARAYFPSIAKLPALDKLAHDLKQIIQEFERILGEATTDKDLPPLIEKKLHMMETAITRSKSFHVDCNNVDRKLRQLVDLIEDEANFHIKQSAFLYQLAVQTMPKSLHCLSMRLTLEYFKSPFDMDQSISEKYLNPDLHHYVIFSSNVLASAAVINSTVMHAKDSGNQFFHVLTDRQSFFAMKLWYFRNTYKESTIQVLNMEDLNLDKLLFDNRSGFLLPEEFRVTFRATDKPSISEIRTEYLSVFSSSHYLLPMIFPSLKKVVILDDDIIVQSDLSDLWRINMDGKVNGAVQSCTVRLGQLKLYLGKSNFDENSCAWMSGLNIVDLVKWREQDLTGTYQRFLQEEQLSSKEGLSELAILRASLLTFQGSVYALDDNWVLSGLGHSYGINVKAIKKAAVLHYNGNMKPWLELSIPKFKGYWRKFLNGENQLLSDCNVNP